MGFQAWVNPIPPFHAFGGTPYNTSITITDVSPAPQLLVPAMYFQVGNIIELNAAGEFSNTGTPNLTLGFYYGGVAGAALAATSAVTTTTGATAWPWQLWYQGRIRSVGATGTIKGQGLIRLGTSLTAFTIRPIPETAAARLVSIDTTTAKTITVGATWGTNSASNTLTCDEFSIQIFN